MVINKPAWAVEYLEFCLGGTGYVFIQKSEIKEEFHVPPTQYLLKL